LPRFQMPVYDQMTSQIIFQLEDVSLYRERTLLLGINWQVCRGEHWVVLGRNGAGKTLLLQILTGYIWPSSGRVSVLNEKFGQVDLRDLRQDIGWVSSALVSRIPGQDTALKVVLSGEFATFGLFESPSSGAVDRAGVIMKDMGLSSLAEERFRNLSRGEQQRVLLARSLVADPKLLILDEPCAGLDLAAREKLLALVNRLAVAKTGPTLIMVTHHVAEIVPGLTHGLLLSRGRILASGGLHEIMTDDLISRAMEISVKIRRVRGRYSAEPRLAS